MLKFRFENIDELMSLHYEAVEDYVRKSSKDVQDKIYANVIQLHGFEGYRKARDEKDYSWLRSFILADMVILRDWVENQPDNLRFLDFQQLYGTRFSNGASNYVDSAGTYNAYALIAKMGIQVCPYCDDEYIDVVDQNGKKKRTSEFDHFFPEGSAKYPALAMCFFNLVLSGSNCNGLKLQQRLGASPYDEDIEDLTFLSPDIEPGVNMDSVEPEECEVLLHAQGGMVENENVLGLKDVYAHRFREAYDLLRKKQHNPDEKLEEMVRMGIYSSVEEARSILFGPSYEEGKYQTIHQKMKHDLVGY